MADARPRALLVAAIALVAAAVLVYWLALRGDGGDASTGSRANGVDDPGRAPPLSAPHLQASDDLLYDSLDEQHVRLESDLVIESIDTDRRWVCTGEPMRMTAKVTGEPVEGASARWVWMEMGGARLHPDDSIFWKAPPVPGSYEVRFQIAKDLGGTKVGVLAERKLQVTVRDCADEELQENEPLRLGAVQRGHGKFELQATYQGDGELVELAWDFGDGQTATTTATAVEHSYDLSDLGPQDTRNYTVRVTATLRRGEPLTASTIAFTGGRPSHDPPKVKLSMDRWSYDEESDTWNTPVSIENPTDDEITWTKLERITKFFDDTHEIRELPWDEAIQIVESLENGGFTGAVVIDASQVPPEVKQIVDRLHGTGGDGEEVIVSWTPFKRAGEAGPPDDPRNETPKGGR